jgi:hypothetical protein
LIADRRQEWPYSPAAERNTAPIAECLAELLPAKGVVLELASGTGQHAVAFAQMFPALAWQPSDASAEALRTIRGRQAAAGLPNLREPLQLDARQDRYPSAGAVLCINMTHITPWEATTGLLEGSSNVLPALAPLIIYGPFIERGIDTALSNLSFDASLRARNPNWGLRELSAIDEEASKFGLLRFHRAAMPANNLLVAYRRE